MREFIQTKNLLLNLKAVNKNFIHLENVKFFANKTFAMEDKDLKVKTKFEENHIELSLNWKSGDNKLEKKFPNIWLRDNCTCSQCYNKITSEIEIDIGKLSLNPKAKDIFHEKNSLEITCNFNHLNKILIL
jgi:hypothetical protein